MLVYTHLVWADLLHALQIPRVEVACKEHLVVLDVEIALAVLIVYQGGFRSPSSRRGFHNEI